jgi:RHS repeat-associated protein
MTSGLKLMPFGEEIQPPNVPNDRTKFATYHRDASGLDYADQRYYSPGTGRFMSSDPYLASGGPSSPGSWNRFAYVEGDPVNRVDPKGLYWCSALDRNVESEEDCYDPSLPNKGYSDPPTTNAPSPDPDPTTNRAKRSVAPGEHTNAQMAMLDGIGLLGDNCIRVITGSKDIQRGRANMGNVVNRITFHDGTDDKNVGLAGSRDKTPFATFHANFPSVAASVLEDRNGRTTYNVVLWADFYGDVAHGNPTPYDEQERLLVHELVHIFTGKNDQRAVLDYGIEMKTGEMNASQAFDRWLRQNCKN